MSVSKRVRYEIHRRDNHTCRYCGGTAPDFTLTVDHVTPVALGGSDDPTNLVTACRDCNAGKTSTTPGAPLVADVAADALQWSAALAAAMKRAEDDWAGREAYRKTFLAAWKRHDRRLTILDPGWVGTLAKWHDIGVPIVLVVEAVDIAFSREKVANGDVFRYACGVVWRRMDDVRDAAEVPRPGEVACGHCEVCRLIAAGWNDPDDQCSVGQPLADDEEPMLCRVCGKRDCFFEFGHQDGEVSGWHDGYAQGERQAIQEYAFRDSGMRALELVVDGDR
jgi:hypothetical protein